MLHGIATRILSQIPRTAMAEGQRRLAEAQIEATSGRHADIGLTLGSRVGSAISIRLQLDAATSMLDRIRQAEAQADITQASLSTLSDLAKDFSSALSGARGAESGKSLAAISGMSSLDALQSVLSTTYDGQYIFGGLSSDTAPFAPYSQGPRQAIIAAFEATFGFPPSSPSAATLSASDVDSFLSGAFSGLFADPDWSTVWSAVPDENVLLRLGPDTAIDLQANASASFARGLAQSFSMIEVLASSSISKDVFQSVADRALSRISEVQLQVVEEQARIGVGQKRLKLASDSISLQKDRFSSAIQTLESVDPYEAATRVNFLMTQLETSYALTGRISRMSLLNYIR